MTDDEAKLAVALGLPIYGSDPELNRLGTKSGSRRIFEEEGVQHPAGLEVDGERDLPRALTELRRGSPGARGAVLKLDKGVSGLGNALLDLAAVDGDVRPAMRLEDPEIDVDEYLRALDDEGGIVEVRIEGDGLPQP